MDNLEVVYYVARLSEDYERQMAGDVDFGPGYIWEMKKKLNEERKLIEKQNEEFFNKFNQLN